MRKYHKYLCPTLDPVQERGCTCDTTDKEMSKEQLKAVVLRQMIKNLDNKKLK